MGVRQLYHQARAAAAPITAADNGRVLVEVDGADYDAFHVRVFASGAVSGTTPAFAVLMQTQVISTATWRAPIATPNILAQNGTGVLIFGRGLPTNWSPAGRLRFSLSVAGTNPSFANVEIVIYGVESHPGDDL